MAERITPSYSDMPRGGGSDKIQMAVGEILQIEERIADEISKTSAGRTQIVQAIGAVEDTRYRELLTLRYISGMTFEQVAEHMHYTRRQVTRLHGAALELVELPDEMS